MMQDIEVRRMVERHLFNEKLLWAGKPTPVRFALSRAARFMLTIVTVSTCLILIAWLPKTFIRNERSIMLDASFLLIVLCAFVLAAVWKGVIQRRKARSLIYAITDRRALIIDPAGGDAFVKSVGITTEIRRRDLADGTGDLIFAQESALNNRRRPRTQELGFYGIENVQLVESIVRRVLRGRV